MSKELGGKPARTVWHGAAWDDSWRSWYVALPTGLPGLCIPYTPGIFTKIMSAMQ